MPRGGQTLRAASGAELARISGPVAVLSPTDVWTFASMSWNKSNRTTWYALNWNGSAWKRAKLTTSTVSSFFDEMTGIAAFGTTNVWAFGEVPPTGNAEGPGQFGAPYAARWNGSTWTQVSMPGTVGAGLSALSPDDIWGFGPTAATAGSAREVIIGMHWNGTSWSTLAVPTCTINGYQTHPDSMFADGPDSVWAVERAWKPANATLLPGTVLTHWNGSAWQVVATDTSDDAIYAIPDGQGGLWMPAYVAKTSKHLLLHYSGGTLATDAVPVYANYDVHLPQALTLIPGSEAIWDPTVLQPTMIGGKWQGAIFASSGP